MEPVVIEVRQSGELWLTTSDGGVLVYSCNRNAAIIAAAAVLRRQLRDPVEVARLTFVGLELDELLAAPSMSPNWKRKGSPIDVELFEQAETFLQTELIPSEEADLLAEYRASLTAWKFSQALECLAELGERQACSNPFWRVLEQLTVPIWPTKWMTDRRAKGQRETRIADIQRRAKGHA